MRQVEHWEQHKVNIEKSALAEHVKELDHAIALDEASVSCNEVDTGAEEVERGRLY